MGSFEFPKDKYIIANISKVTVQDNKIILSIKITSMEPNLYEIPTVFTIDNDECVTRIETIIYINIELKYNIVEVSTEDSTNVMGREVNNETSINKETSNTNDNSESTEKTN